MKRDFNREVEKEKSEFSLYFEGDNNLDCVLKGEARVKDWIVFSLGFWMSLLPEAQETRETLFPLFFGVEVG